MLNALLEVSHSPVGQICIFADFLRRNYEKGKIGREGGGAQNKCKQERVVAKLEKIVRIVREELQRTHPVLWAAIIMTLRQGWVSQNGNALRLHILFRGLRCAPATLSRSMNHGHYDNNARILSLFSTDPKPSLCPSVRLCNRNTTRVHITHYNFALLWK